MFRNITQRSGSIPQHRASPLPSKHHITPLHSAGTINVSVSRDTGSADVLSNHFTQLDGHSSRPPMVKLLPLMTAPDVVHMVVCVADSGCGLSAANQQKLFKPFVQIDAARLQQSKVHTYTLRTRLDLTLCALECS